MVAHLGCSLSSPTLRCVRRPACAVANKALLGLRQNGWNPESHFVLVYSLDVYWVLVGSLMQVYLLLLSIYLAVYVWPSSSTWTLQYANKSWFLDFVDSIFLDSDLPPKVPDFYEILGRICWTPPSTFETPNEVLTELNKKHTAKASPASWGGENTNELIIYCTGLGGGGLVVWKSARICRLETQTTYQWTLWWKEYYES